MPAPFLFLDEIDAYDDDVDDDGSPINLAIKRRASSIPQLLSEQLADSQTHRFRQSLNISLC